MTKHRTVRIGSIFNTDRKTIWNNLTRIETLRYIASPYATFTAVENTDLSSWQEGETFRLRFKLLGLISLGIHTIRVIRLDEQSAEVYTQESNRAVPIWNHRIVLSETDQGTQYVDEVEIYAGWKTYPVYLWAKCFYRHRQRKWQKLLHQRKPR